MSLEHDASHQRYNPAEPLALFEWQGMLQLFVLKLTFSYCLLGGAFSYWSGPSYQDCYKLINEQFANVRHLSLSCLT